MNLSASSLYCKVKKSEGRGRGVFATRRIPSDTIIEESPVLLFDKNEYEAHGKYTVLAHFTLEWPDGRMALPFGIGSLFNHSEPPNVTITFDKRNEIIQYTTSRTIEQGEELRVFNIHRPTSTQNLLQGTEAGEVIRDDRGGMQDVTSISNPFSTGNPRAPVHELDLPFLRTKVVPDDGNEDNEGSVRTAPAWVVDVPDPKLTSTLLKWVKKTGLETPDLEHLRRIRRSDTSSQLLLTAGPSPPDIPANLGLPAPYTLDLPISAALTPETLKLKSAIWPTVYTPKRKWEPEPWSRAKAAWAWDAVQTLLAEASRAKECGELPIVSYVPRPYVQDIAMQDESDMPDFIATDLRQSAAHPLRHSVLHVIRKVADWRASRSSSLQTNNDAFTGCSSTASSMVPNDENDDASTTNAVGKSKGSNYLLTSLTLFTTHEPCIMCSMALLHSRLRELVFIRPMESTGGCGGSSGRGTCIPKLKNVNHRYSILRWGNGESGRLLEDHFEILESVDAEIDA